MSQDARTFLIFGVWFGVAIIAAGIYREVKGRWDDDGPIGPMMICAFWPLVVAAAVAIGAGWCTLWLGRGPVRIVRWCRSRNRLPRAEVRR